jgi:FkbM family methyltransferase
MRAKTLISSAIRFLSKSNLIFKVFQLIIDEVYKKIFIVNHNKQKMFFSVPNYLALYRCETFATKEPDTLSWIEEMTNDSVFWDIGANVGLYSVYASKYNNCKVFSFEPSVFNLELLARNININNLQDLITIVPLPLTNLMAIQKFKMSNITWGGALSTFGENFDQYGNDLGKPTFEYSFPGFSMDDAKNILNIESPDYIKIDVDGIEHLILEGGVEVLRSVKSILLEVNDSFKDQSQMIQNSLVNAGFKMYKKCDMGDDFFFNQWWVKNEDIL